MSPRKRARLLPVRKSGQFLRGWFYILIVTVCVSPTSATAQMYSVLHQFDPSNGARPRGRLLISGGILYGTTTSYGVYPSGVVYKLSTADNSFTSFSLGIPVEPQSGLVLSGSTLYGTAWDSTRDFGGGTAFAVKTDGTGTVVLRTFSLADGVGPRAELTLDGATLHGTMSSGGALNSGTLFRLNIDGSGFTRLASLSADTGTSPTSALVVSGNWVFGTAISGGISNNGTVFRMNTDGSGFTVLKRFSGRDGCSPGGLLLSGTTLYGITALGGTYNQGTIFRLSVDGSGFVVLKEFTGPDGGWPIGSLVQIDTSLYGITQAGGIGSEPNSNAGNGVIFQIETDGSMFYVLRTLDQSDGIKPGAGLALWGNTLYGTTQFGGAADGGTVFSLVLPLAPRIIISPSNQVAAVGSAVSFGVTALGSHPFGYQWVLNGTNLLQGATNSTLELPVVAFSDAGFYTAMVTNVHGADVTSPAQLRVIAPSVVTNCSEVDLRAVLRQGGRLAIACDGTFELENTLQISRDTALDASGHRVTISGVNRVQVFQVDTNATFSLASLTVANGLSTNGQGGGAIYNQGGTVSLLGVTFLSNVATNPAAAPTNMGCGGAIFNFGGIIHATNCLFEQNASQNGEIPFNLSLTNETLAALGGAICSLAGVVEVEDCAFTSNCVIASGWQPSSSGDSSPGPIARGGAIYSSGSLVVNRCTFVANSAIGGAGGTGPPTTFVPDVVGGQGGEAEGGAICSLGPSIFRSSLFATNSAVGGSGGNGGNGKSGGWGVYGSSGGSGATGGEARGGGVLNEGTAEVVNCTFAANFATGGQGGGGGAAGYWVDLGTGQWRQGAPGYGGNGGVGAGGAMFSTNGVVVITNCTVAFNFGLGGTNGYNGGSNGTAMAALSILGGAMANTLLASNTPANGIANMIDSGHNLSSDLSCQFTNTGSMNNREPRLGPLSANGGATLTMALLPGSPAIDGADTSSAPATDQRGFPRPVGAAADIGAFEFGSPALLQILNSPVGDFAVVGIGVPGRACDLQTSTNLANWTPVSSGEVSAAGTVSFHEARPESLLFYRLVFH